MRARTGAQGMDMGLPQDERSRLEDVGVMTTERGHVRVDRVSRTSVIARASK